jgi:hypothetical protein
VNKLTEKSEEELIGTLIKLRKRDNELAKGIDGLVGRYHESALNKAIEPQYPSSNVPERMYLAKMSVNPDRIIELAEKLRKVQADYKIAHEELRAFEKANPSIVEKYGSGGYIYY